ncbi:MAG: GYD domain-containing protein [Alphaproteobacteria bacterium]
MKFILIGTHAPEWVGRSRERTPRASAKARELGIVVTANYFTQGQYDFVSVLDCPDAVSASAFSIWYMEQGFGRVQTMLAYDSQEFGAVLDKVAAKS